MQEFQTWDKLGLFRSVILLGFFLFFSWLIISGNSMRYLSPLLSPFLYFGATGFLLLTIVQVRKSRIQHGDACECGHNHHHPNQPAFKKGLSYGLIILPLLLAVIVPYQVPERAIAAKNSAPSSVEATPSRSVQPANTDSVDPNDPVQKAASELKKKDKIIVNDDNYFTVLSVFDQYPDELVGKNIQMSGMVYADSSSSYQKKELGRVLIACCVADATFYGAPLITSNIEKYKQGSWVSIEGKIDKLKVNGEERDCIKAVTMKKISSPKDPYIYPSF
ncbi:TIGR03943 family protein [Aneurinibacillus sp. Ricciae_BoGa-3]|uniref:TIGR03943 family putative permease subunit n=1 Tax=Aneurinibacillus sp. Ricciae_BoGa-3 TaxID=3022697 RepID=UPI0023418946|nr:TIGR03943 family protein [Aneurinibacillus sp. Ricciae_BoGa-3]WCK53248.1 TIGR03943 family protein [Aneurinibacillus sp. Ricciae_BoGa-3]